LGTPAYLINDATEIEPRWFDGVSQIGVTAGASAPQILVDQVIERLQALGAMAPEELAGREENITFSLPKELRLKPVG